MRRIACSLILCLLLTACTVGIVQRQDLTPAASATPTPGATPTDTPRPTPTPAPSPSPSPASTKAGTPAEMDAGPAIQFFRATVEEAATGSVTVYEWHDAWPVDPIWAAPGDTVVFEWESSAAASATLQRHYSDPWSVGTTGALTYRVQPDDIGCLVFTLDVADESERHVSALFDLRLPCPESLFFAADWRPNCCGLCGNHGCPDAPITSDAAQQHFERGAMIWVKEQDRIYVLFDDVPSGSERACQMFADEWDEGESDCDPSLIPPDGLYQPIRGFGLVWRQNPDVRQRLGWAADLETAFETTVQHAPGYGRHSSEYLRAIDGGVLHLYSIGFGSAWERIETEE